MSDSSDNSHTFRSHGEAVSTVQLPQSLTRAVDAWAEAHKIPRSDAICELIELGLRVASSSASHHVPPEAFAIEDEAVAQIRRMLDPSLPPDERERRIRRLIDGPPEFYQERIDLPKHEK